MNPGWDCQGCYGIDKMAFLMLLWINPCTTKAKNPHREYIWFYRGGRRARELFRGKEQGIFRAKNAFVEQQ